jgi:predicted unusual protein kinase regulating ubiquinone biosynthesis (AarF/ABC1/UbiB family)
MKRWRRGWYIFATLAPFLVGFLRDRRRWLIFGRPALRDEAHHARRSMRFASTLAKLGPTFIKLAQVFSARADILREPYLSAIGQLHDRVPAASFDAIHAVLEAELGHPADDIFSGFEREPVAAASLGQVHRAQVGGQDVAVKILRPGVEELVAIDLEISFRILFFLNILFPNHHIRGLTNVVREFSARVQEEMDFRQEAANIALFHKHFDADPRVRAPRVHEALTRRRVLVTEWVDGDKIDRLAPRFASGQLDFHSLMDTLSETYIRMMLVDGFMHADPHPGNILVQQDGTIVFLDWGMVAQFTRSTRDSILRIALAAAREDVEGMIGGMYQLGMIDPEISRAEVREAAAEIVAIVARVRELGVRRVQELVQEIMDTFYTWPVMLPRELVYFFRAAALLEGIGFRYDPAFNGLEQVRPVVLRMKTELLQATLRPPREIARGVMEEVRAGFAALRDVIDRAEREELRVRIHPRDLMQAQRFLLLQVRRILLSIFGIAIAIVAAITFVGTGSVWLLGGGLLIGAFFFLFVLLLPTHLFENPLRHARGTRRDP